MGVGRVLRRIAQQRQQLLGGQSSGAVGVGEEAVGQVALAIVQRYDLLLDRIGHDQAVDRDRPRLADAVGAIRGLVFDGRVPPGVQVDDVVRGGQVQTGPSGAQADQKDGALAGLEGVDPFGAVGGGGAAIQVLIPPSRALTASVPTRPAHRSRRACKQRSSG